MKATIEELPPAARKAVKQTLIVVGDLPGAEIVVDGMDPRAGILLDEVRGSEAKAGAEVGRLFIYQRNLERLAGNAVELDRELAQCLGQELAAVFPTLRGVLGAQERGTSVRPQVPIDRH